MNAMMHRGYAARVEYDAEDRIFVGRVAGIKEAGAFHGATVDELEDAFRETVDHYLEGCDRLGQKPGKPYSGKLLLRIAPETHAAMATAADVAGKSLNQWAAEALERAAR
jgi:predicted HicB family RNase H-like nuclease